MPTHSSSWLRRLTQLALVAGTLGSSAHATVIFDYRFESGPDGAPITTVVDSGPNGLNGTGNGILTYSSQTAATGGNFAMDASGDLNYARVANNSLMHVQEFTLSALVNPTGPGSAVNCWDDGMCNIVTKKWRDLGGNFLDSYSIYYLQGTGKFRSYIGFGNETGRMLESSDSYLVGSGWHAVLLTLDRDVSGSVDRLSLYVDNVLQASLDEALPDLFFNDFDLFMGASNFGDDANGDFRRNFDGMIDSVQLTDLPFTPNVVPTPPTVALLLAGIVAGVVTRRHRERSGAPAER